MALKPWQKGTVIRIEQETADTRRFWIQAEGNTFDFEPGQFITFDLPIHERPNKRMRSYSIASWPDGTNVFELIIVLDKAGLGTNYLFNEVITGTELTFRGPMGVFTLKMPIEKDLFLICTGTGIAPFRSMVHHIREKKMETGNIYMVFGCRTKADLLYYDELTKLQQEMPHFHYLPTLSREQWEGPTGYVHQVYSRYCEQKQPAQFFLCGWKGMIDEARKTLFELGYGTHDIHVEIYG